MYDALIRLLYRVIAPGHPRSRVRFDAVYEGSASTLWIHTHGMLRWGLHEVEMVAVPCHLRGYAHGLLFDIIGYMRDQKPILPDEHFGGMLVSEDQPVYHLVTARLITRAEDPQHSQILRFVDHKADPETGFPVRLFASHISALATRERSAATRERMFRMALDLQPPGSESETDDIRDNANNWVALEGLGNALCDLERVPEGLEYLSKAAAASPNAMRSLASHFREAIENHQLPPGVGPSLSVLVRPGGLTQNR